MEECSILTLLIITHSKRKSFDCLAHHLRPHYTLLMCFMCFVIEPQAPLDHAKRNMMGSARVVVAANLLFVPFAAMMLVVDSLFILDGHYSKVLSLLTLFHCLFSCNNVDDTWGVKLTKGSLQDKKNLFQRLGSFQFFR